MAGSERSDGRRSRWTQHNEQRRVEILDAAIAAIETSAPGAEVPVAQIAAAAGINRTVLYRHFADRADLDRAIQGHIFRHIQAQMLPVITLEGTPRQIIRRIVGAYVGWAAEHPSLHRFADQQPLSVGGTEADLALTQLARQVRDLIGYAAEALGAEIDDDTRHALDPLVFGLLGLAIATVHRWLTRIERRPSQDAMADVLTEAIWLQLSGMAAARGVALEPDVPVEEQLRLLA
jgi:AcrR family transcriptional regulator